MRIIVRVSIDENFLAIGLFQILYMVIDNRLSIYVYSWINDTDWFRKTMKEAWIWIKNLEKTSFKGNEKKKEVEMAEKMRRRKKELNLIIKIYNAGIFPPYRLIPQKRACDVDSAASKGVVRSSNCERTRMRLQ